VKNAAGEVVATCETELDEDWSVTNVLYLILDTEVTEAGSYTITIPEGRFTFGESGDTDAPAYTLEYTVTGTATGINGISADAKGCYNVYSVSGVHVMSTNNGAELKGLKQGVYIINGKKVAVK